MKGEAKGENAITSSLYTNYRQNSKRSSSDVDDAKTSSVDDALGSHFLVTQGSIIQMCISSLC